VETATAQPRRRTAVLVPNTYSRDGSSSNRAHPRRLSSSIDTIGPIEAVSTLSVCIEEHRLEI